MTADLQIPDRITLPNGLAFDEETHRYWLDDAEVPSVTTVLAGAGLVDWTYCNEWARERGSLVHKAIHIELTSGLDWASVDELFHPYISAALAALQDMRCETKVSEGRVFSRLYGYAGTLDWIGIVDGKLSLFDWKTGPTVPAYALQTAAYADAYAEETGQRVERRYAVRLKQDGTYCFEPFASRDDIVNFRAALRVVQWKREKGLLAA